MKEFRFPVKYFKSTWSTMYKIDLQPSVLNAKLLE